MEKHVHKAKLSEHNEKRQNLEYWLSRTPAERVEAVEILRRQRHGDKELSGIPRVARVRKLGEE